MRVKGILLARLLFAAAALAGTALQRPDARAGTELGNARFAEYANPLHGIVFRYPEEWDVIDLGNAVNVVGTAPAERVDPSSGAGERAQEASRSPELESRAAGSASEGLERVESVEIFFDTARRFATFIAFERHVRATRPGYRWRPLKFHGRHSFEARAEGRVHVMVLKDADTVMQVSYPYDPSTGLPTVLVNKTVDSLSFLDTGSR